VYRWLLAPLVLVFACSAGGAARDQGSGGDGGSVGAGGSGGSGGAGGSASGLTSYYLILHEQNTDTLSTSLEPTPPSGPAPFELVDGAIRVRSDVVSNAANGLPHDAYPLTTVPQSLDALDAALFVEHRVTFPGQGRKFGFVRYLIFESVPANLDLPRYDGDAERLDLKLLDNILALLTVRYPAGQLHIVEELDTLSVNATSLTTGEATQIHSESHLLRVTTEEVTPLPEDFTGISDVGSRVFINDWGDSTFSTELSAELLGRFDAVAR
jgi:hypothetical protein